MGICSSGLNASSPFRAESRGFYRGSRLPSGPGSVKGVIVVHIRSGIRITLRRYGARAMTRELRGSLLPVIIYISIFGFFARVGFVGRRLLLARVIMGSVSNGLFRSELGIYWRDGRFGEAGYLRERAGFLVVAGSTSGPSSTGSLAAGLVSPSTILISSSVRP